MGDWVVLKAWNQSADGFHECRFGDTPSEILYAMCYPVIEQHQFQGPEVPEFTISVKWQDGNLDEYLAGKNSHAHGWRYIMRWMDPTERRIRHISGYGFPSEQAARDEAELKAIKIVRAQQPEKVYKFTPEV